MIPLVSLRAGAAMRLDALVDLQQREACLATNVPMRLAREDDPSDDLVLDTSVRVMSVLEKGEVNRVRVREDMRDAGAIESANRRSFGIDRLVAELPPHDPLPVRENVSRVHMRQSRGVGVGNTYIFFLLLLSRARQILAIYGLCCQRAIMNFTNSRSRSPLGRVYLGAIDHKHGRAHFSGRVR